ncbi:hypothetical protein C5B96_13900 [Subtercola sp. Z020]|uniref:hypothetical protein n=1 Tax=Subtercola sp. Z020 TaxID=2080582 RepID=UPI000CE90A64|nr:hypothetical protein [Subtercola sp. Z020]PPF78922.1 hypothetical protein C5B96_13900 [Subtercola sp. Z020]
MTTATAPAPTRPRTLVSRVSWHRPLLALAAAMGALALIAAIGSVVDPREITGVPLWNKPLLFAVSVGVYALTLSWLLGMLTRFRRVVHVFGTIATIGLAIEMVIIVGVALAGTTSHFNVSTPLATVLWGVMAVSIVVVWMLGIPVAVLLFRTDLGDPARSLAVRAGLLLALVGMGLAFLMTGPQGSQITDYQGIVGAHTVGVADGGPGLPLVGWSTVGGDLRIPHFIGMHALQLVPLAALVLELVARRVPALAVLREARVRAGLVAVFVALYVGVLALVTVQALAGEPLVHPSGTTLAVGGVLAAAALVAGGIVLAVGRRPAQGR